MKTGRFPNYLVKPIPSLPYITDWFRLKLNPDSQASCILVVEWKRSQQREHPNWLLRVDNLVLSEPHHKLPTSYGEDECCREIKASRSAQLGTVPDSCLKMGYAPTLTSEGGVGTCRRHRLQVTWILWRMRILQKRLRKYRSRRFRPVHPSGLIPSQDRFLREDDLVLTEEIDHELPKPLSRSWMLQKSWRK